MARVSLRNRIVDVGDLVVGVRAGSRHAARIAFRTPAEPAYDLGMPKNISRATATLLFPALCFAQGLFENHTDVGTVLHAGSTEYDTSKKAYTLTGSGENMWATADGF